MIPQLTDTTGATWRDYGYSPLVTRSLQADPKFITADEYNAMIQDGSITSQKIQSGSITTTTVESISADKITAGTMDAAVITINNIRAGNINTGKLQTTDTKTYFDVDNNIFILNDGTNDRVLIGYDDEGFGTGKDWGMKISEDGYDVKTCATDKLVMTSQYKSFKIVKEMSGTITADGSAVAYTSVENHALGYKPMVFGSIVNSDDNIQRLLPAAFFNLSTYRIMGAYAQIENITTTNVTVKVEICSATGLSTFGGNNETFDYKLYFVREIV